MTTISFADAMRHPKFFGPWFASSTWDVWHAVHKAADGLPLNASERLLFQRVAGNRASPTRRVRELIELCGRRSGKSHTTAARVAYEAVFRDYRHLLKPGELGSILYFATDRAQAKIAIGYLRGFFREIPMLANMVVRETADDLELNNGVVITVCTNDFRRPRGRTIVCAVFEECAFYNDAESANPAGELYNAVIPGMLTIPGALLIAPSTGWRRAGWFFEKVQQSYGVDDPDVLVIKGTSLELNPGLNAEIIAASIAADPAAGEAEWGGGYRSDLESYAPRDVVEASTEWGCYARAPRQSTQYVAFVDPSGSGGGNADSYTWAVAHEEEGVAVLDHISEVRPKFSPEQVTKECALLLKTYGITAVHGDAYAGEWPREQFAKHGVQYVVSDKNRSEIYVALLPALNSGRVRLLENKRLMAQLLGLERRAGRSGKDAINHAPGAHDDIINAAAGALILANRGMGITTEEIETIAAINAGAINHQSQLGAIPGTGSDLSRLIEQQRAADAANRGNEERPIDWLNEFL
jgi:hypothetical protein